MTDQRENTAFDDAMQILVDEGFTGMAECITILVKEAMILERQRYLKALPYERNETRKSHANGYKNKTVQTRVGSISLNVPQTRDCEFYPSVLEKGLRSERALKLALAEMYIQGVSTRRVARITEELCGFEVTSSQVSRAAAELDSILQEWRNRKLSQRYPYLFLDARYESIRHGGQVVDCAVFIASGVDQTGHREILGCSVALGEQEVHWRSFLAELTERGLHGVELIVSDAHGGLKAARKAIFPSVPWQRCQFHLQQNAQSYIPSKGLKKVVASDIRSVFNAPDKGEAERLLNRFTSTYSEKAPNLANWAEVNLPEGFAAFGFPEEHRKRLRTTNGLERINQEVKRRTRTVRIFPNEQSCLRLVTAILMEISEDWQSSHRYMKIDDET